MLKSRRASSPVEMCCAYSAVRRVIAWAGTTFFPEDLTRPGAKNYPRATLQDNQAG